MNAAIRAVLPLALGCAAATFAGCRPSDEAAPADTAAQADTSGMAGMPGHAGMMSGATMDSMHAHMSRMDTMSAATIKAMLPTHRRVVDSMLTQMSSDMRGRNVTADAAWTATADSIRADLDRLATLEGAQLKTAMTAHHQRMMRLMQMHRGTMGRTKA